LATFPPLRRQIDHLISARPPEKGELGFFTASLTRGRIMAARREYQQAREDLGKALEYFHLHGLYYYEAQASMAIALCDFNLGTNAACSSGCGA